MNPLLNSSQGKFPSSVGELKSMVQSNPQIRALLAMHNGNAKEAFRALCRQKGVDPEEFMRRLRG